ncbi:hypothetical protein H257_00965 [Aphanomyces astaci]|uniref:DDE Tnp4 domain-containing protein n=1 Tax=Aphanomyces astaci TaxID=112090 RepID=W4H709_APHAT|nr:hypothetical protein H257_00965 [Aphanomyces astaci]ETV87366.1 hypothetical protein H257_00965 [Aphanomyces astaci]|eukprot:XP_009822229.1 hypothetical protein H257_00965 [Aphanomyces astaci]
MRVTSIIESLQEQHAVDQINLAECLRMHGDTIDQHDDLSESAHPIIDAILEDSGCDGFKTMCNFTSAAECPDNALDCWLRQEMHATHFKFKAPTFQKLITKVIAVVEPIFFRHFIKMPSMTDLRNKDVVFANYTYALYATDVKFKPAERRRAASTSSVTILVASTSYMSDHCPGSVNDLTMFMDRLTVHRTSLAKMETEMAINDVGEQFDDHRGYWACLVDKGYVGIMHHTRGIYPKKKPTGGALDTDDLNRNKRVSSDRVVVENYFGRVCQLWKVSYATFTWGHDIFDGILRLTFALTNYHVTLMPLRANDRVTYRSVLARYQSMSKAYIDRRNETQRRSRRRRGERDLMGSAIGRRMSSLNDSPYSRRLPSQNNSPTLR